MRFGFFSFIIAIGLFGAILSNGVSRSRSPGDEAFRRAAEEAHEGSFGESASATEERRPLDHAVELDRQPDGHFYADVQVNGTTLHMLVDTGASIIALSREDARSAGLATSIGMHEVIGRGADGDVHGEVATLERVSLGEKTAEGLPAVVLNSGEQSLLGQSFLGKFDKVEIRGDKMLLE